MSFAGARLSATFSARLESENAQESVVGHIVHGGRERDNPCAMCQCVPPEWFSKTETFSAVADIQGQSPAGSALQLQEQGKRVAATLRDYRGKAIPAVTKLPGSIEESEPVGGGPTTCKVRLSGKDNRGPVEVEGEITPGYFKGIINRRTGNEVFSYRLSLKRQVSNEENRVGILRYGFGQMLQTTIQEHMIAKIGTDSVSRMVWMPL